MILDLYVYPERPGESLIQFKSRNSIWLKGNLKKRGSSSLPLIKITKARSQSLRWSGSPSASSRRVTPNDSAISKACSRLSRLLCRATASMSIRSGLQHKPVQVSLEHSEYNLNKGGRGSLRPESVQQGIEDAPVAPWWAEVGAAEARITFHRLLAP